MQWVADGSAGGGWSPNRATGKNSRGWQCGRRLEPKSSDWEEIAVVCVPDYQNPNTFLERTAVRFKSSSHLPLNGSTRRSVTRPAKLPPQNPKVSGPPTAGGPPFPNARSGTIRSEPCGALRVHARCGALRVPAPACFGRGVSPPPLVLVSVCFSDGVLRRSPAAPSIRLFRLDPSAPRDSPRNFPVTVSQRCPP